MEERLFPEENEWDKWVEEHPWGRYTYLSGYGKVIKKVFNFPYFYLFHKEGDKIQSGFPVFLLRNLCGKRYLLSIPFSEYGGPLGESKVFISEIEQILKDTKAHFLEIHGGTGMKEDSSYLTFPMHHYALLHIKQKKPQDILEKAHASVRKNLKKAWKEKLVVKRDKGEAFFRKHFYPLYLISHKRLGSPPLPLQFFLYLNRYLSPYIRVISIVYQEKVISSLLGWSVGKSFHITHIVSDHRYWHLRSNDLAHWEMIRWAIEEKKEVFDFGPARYVGQIRYKEKWGVNFYPYNYFYYPPEISVSPPQAEQGIYHCLSFIWRLTLPEFLTPILGKFIRGHLGI
ncbi:GNAT family N-acetyltransferase [Candidatus Calescamantes bacterium]|nr:GNAT family N-acetyltransferase [Candidatus Calescamantes bacterium]